MSFKPMKPTQLNTENIRFSPVKTLANGSKSIYVNYNDSSIFLHMPELAIRGFDSGNFFPTEGKPGSGKYAVKMDLNGHTSDPQVKAFFDKISEMDEIVKQAGIDNSVAWFKKKVMTADTINNAYNPMIKHSVDKETGEPNGKYPPSFTFKVNQYDGVVQCKFFDGDKKAINVNKSDEEDYQKVGICIPFKDRMSIPHEGIFKKGAMVKGVLRCKAVWLMNGNFGVRWDAEQLRVKAPPSFDDYAFLDDSDGEEGGEKLEGNFVNSSSDEEEDGDGAMTRQVSTKR
jgi:hypothetical protein